MYTHSNKRRGTATCRVITAAGDRTREADACSPRIERLCASMDATHIGHVVDRCGGGTLTFWKVIPLYDWGQEI